MIRNVGKGDWKGPKQDGDVRCEIIRIQMQQGVLLRVAVLPAGLHRMSIEMWSWLVELMSAEEVKWAVTVSKHRCRRCQKSNDCILRCVEINQCCSRDHVWTVCPEANGWDTTRWLIYLYMPILLGKHYRQGHQQIKDKSENQWDR